MTLRIEIMEGNLTELDAMLQTRRLFAEEAKNVQRVSFYLFGPEAFATFRRAREEQIS